jgi:hypothetical protein
MDLAAGMLIRYIISAIFIESYNGLQNGGMVARAWISNSGVTYNME